jgi:hypothetical protein
MISFLIFFKLLNNIFENLKNEFHGDRELHGVAGAPSAYRQQATAARACRHQTTEESNSGLRCALTAVAGRWFIFFLSLAGIDHADCFSSEMLVMRIVVSLLLVRHTTLDCI